MTLLLNRQRNIDLVIKYVISEEDAKQRIGELKEERLRVEAELAALEEAPVPIALHPATLDRYIETVNELAETMAGHANAEDDRGALVDDFRALVHSVIVRPKGPWQGFEVEVKGKLVPGIRAE
jgi:site-specific DNA recombinase